MRNTVSRTVIDDYIDGFPLAVQARLRAVRKTIRRTLRRSANRSMRRRLFSETRACAWVVLFRESARAPVRRGIVRM